MEYCPASLRQIDIPKKSGGSRTLIIPSLIDRIAQSAVASVLNPHLEPHFSPHSYAYRAGKSVDQAVRSVNRFYREGYGFVAEADIVKCFDNIPHAGLMQRLESLLASQAPSARLFELIELWLEQFALELGQKHKGLAQGSPLSPLLANVYLDQLDDALEEKNIRIVRFADDFVLLAKSEAAACKALDNADQILGKHGLELKPSKTRVVSFQDGFDFLGHLFVRSLVVKKVVDPSEDPIGVMAAQADLDEQPDVEGVIDSPARPFAAGQRTLFVMEPGRSVGLRNASFKVSDSQGNQLIALNHTRVDRIELGPHTQIETAALRHASATDTQIDFVDGHGHCIMSIAAPDYKRAGLQLAQAGAVLDPDRRWKIAHKLVDVRLRNQRAQLHRLNRQVKDAQVIKATVQLGRILRKLERASGVEALRGHEGEGAAIYWPALGSLCQYAQQPFSRQRPAKNPLNASINYLTALLERDVRSATIKAGLHPGFGALHSARDGNEALVYDMMEIYRAALTEGLAVTLFNQKRLDESMFQNSDQAVFD